MKENTITAKEKYYEIIMSLFALIAVSLLAIEYLSSPSESIVRLISVVDTIILGIFTIDYFARLILSKRKLEYIKNNIFELIAIIPLSSIFRIARISRLVRVLRITKVARFARVGIFVNRFSNGIIRFLNLNGFSYVVVLTLVITFVGAVLIKHAETMSWGDSLWWSFVTITTVGYGDLSPESALGRFVAIVLMLVGIGFIGMLTGTIATFFIKPPEKSIRQETVELIKTRIGKESLNDEDIEQICKLVKSLKGDVIK